MDVAEIEKRVDRAIAAPITVNMEVGGVALENMGQVMEFAKLMSVSGSAVPKYLRGNPGGCLAICSRALRWQMDPFAVAEKSYQVVNKGEERIAYEAQLVHAVITARAPLKTRLRHEITGEGDERRCRVWGTFRGEDTPHSYTSETLAKLRDARGRNEYGNIKGSPLWDTVPEVQLAYSTYRQWCRLFASEVMLGIYTPDELEDGTTKVIEAAPSKIDAYAQKLREAKAARAEEDRGFNQGHVTEMAAGRSSIIEGEINSDPAEQKDDTNERSNDEPVGERRADGDQGGGVRDRHEGGSGEGGGAIESVRAELAGQEAPPPGEADLLDGQPKSTGKGKGKR